MCAKGHTPKTFRIPCPVRHIGCQKVRSTFWRIRCRLSLELSGNFNSVVLNGANALSLQRFTQTGPNSFIANLVINASAIGSSPGAQSFVRTVPIGFTVSISGATATITGCGAADYTSTPTTCVSHPTFTGFNGYYKTSSGLITQRGLLNSSSSDDTQISVNFPIPFPNNCFIVTGSEASDRSGFAIGCASTSQHKIRTANHDTCVNWIAYGN